MAEIMGLGMTMMMKTRGSPVTSVLLREKRSPANHRTRPGHIPAPIATAVRWLALGQVEKENAESDWGHWTSAM